MTDQLSIADGYGEIISHSTLADSFYHDFCDSIEHSGKGYDLTIIKNVEIKPELTGAYNRISIADQTVFKVYGKRVFNISLNPLLTSLFEEYGISFKPSEAKVDSGTWKRLAETEFRCLKNAPELASKIIEIFLRQDGFGCCSRYEDCSNAGHCIHPDIMFAVQCAYRQNLIDGKISYGKNQNI